MKKFFPLLISLFIIGCSNQETNEATPKEQFSKELFQLKDYFQIPGMAVIVKKGNQTLYEDYLGLADVEKEIPMDSVTTIPMASLTKIFAATMAMKLVDEGKISLEDPVGNYVEGNRVPDSVKIKHIISHTSPGDLGQNFYYNNSRFMLLGNIIEKVSGKSFKSNIQEEIITPLGLTKTYLLEDSTQVANEGWKIASPYFLGGEMKDGYQEKIVTDGFIDYGYSAAAGISSTVQDLATLILGLENEEFLSAESRNKMFVPFEPGLPYGYGTFSQTFMGEQLVWGYGQYDCYSSLLLKVPAKDLTLVIAANNNLMSDPARLIAGDVTYSLFAMSFLKSYVFDFQEISLFEDSVSLSSIDENINDTNRDFYRQKLLGQSVAASFMGRFDGQEVDMSKAILRQVFDIYPDHVSYGDLIVMHNLNTLKFMDSFREKGDFTEFDNQLLGIGESLLNKDAFNPYANYYMANYYQAKNNNDSTSYYFNQIVNAKNFSRWWYTIEAKSWLNDNGGE